MGRDWDDGGDEPYDIGEWEWRSETDLAYLIVEPDLDPSEEQMGINMHWIPKSVVCDFEPEEIGDVGEVSVKMWWARKEEF